MISFSVDYVGSVLQYVGVFQMLAYISDLSNCGPEGLDDEVLLVDCLIDREVCENQPFFNPVRPFSESVSGEWAIEFSFHICVYVRHTGVTG